MAQAVSPAPSKGLGREPLLVGAFSACVRGLGHFKAPLSMVCQVIGTAHTGGGLVLRKGSLYPAATLKVKKWLADPDTTWEGPGTSGGSGL